MTNISVQINITPKELDYVKILLPVQLSLLHDCVNEFLVVIDYKKSKGHFGNETNWDELYLALLEYLDGLKTTYRKLCYKNVDYSINLTVAKDLLNLERPIPNKDHRGGPYYSYFFGLWAAKSTFVFHLDSDVILNGHNPCEWFKEAIDILNKYETISVCSPHPGPPASDGKLKQPFHQHQNGLYYFKSFSSRVFFINKESFFNDHPYLPKKTFRIKNVVKSLLSSNNFEKLPENLISTSLEKSGKFRADFWGKKGNLYSLHIPYKSTKFLKQLPLILEKIRNNEIPFSQQGYYDIHDSMYDWSEERNLILKKRK